MDHERFVEIQLRRTKTYDNLAVVICVAFRIMSTDQDGEGHGAEGGYRIACTSSSKTVGFTR